MAVFLGALINNPWTFIPILAASLYTGLYLMGKSSPTTIEWDQLTMDNIFDMLWPYLIPFLIGACTLAVLASLLAYPAMRWTITRYRNMAYSKSSETRE